MNWLSWNPPPSQNCSQKIHPEERAALHRAINTAYPSIRSYTIRPAISVDHGVSLASRGQIFLSSSNLCLGCLEIVIRNELGYSAGRLAQSSAQRSPNHLCVNASCAVSLLAGSKLVKPPIRSLKSASTFFHRENGLRGVVSLKPSRTTSRTWDQGLSPR